MYLQTFRMQNHRSKLMLEAKKTDLPLFDFKKALVIFVIQPLKTNMKKLIIESTDSSPRVHLDPEKSIFIITGESRTEDSETFYEPVINWFKEYQQYLADNNLKKNIVIEMHIDFYNSATARSFIDLFATLEKFVGSNLNALVKWYYMEQDEDLKTQGKELAFVVPGLPFEVICLEAVNS